MKYLLPLFLTAIFMIGCHPKSDDSQEPSVTKPTKKSAGSTSYGAPISVDNARDISWLAGSIQPGDSLHVKISGEITATCPMKGCWMKLKGPDEDVRVTFKDYGFFVPTKGMEGKQAVVEGYAVKKVIDVSTLKHYAEDAGKSEEEIAAITTPQEEISLVASGVVIGN